MYGQSIVDVLFPVAGSRLPVTGFRLPGKELYQVTGYKPGEAGNRQKKFWWCKFVNNAQQSRAIHDSRF
jgi:hypothetical protein